MKGAPVVYLAAQNLRRRWIRTLIILTAMAVTAGAGYLAAAVTRSVDLGLAVSAQRLGADLVVTAEGAREQVRAALDRGGPVDGRLAPGIGRDLSSMPDVERISLQFFLGQVRLSPDARPVSVIGYDPRTDFTVRPWLPQTGRRPAAAEELILGARVEVPAGAAPDLGSIPDLAAFKGGFRTTARLEASGTGMDESIYVPLPESWPGGPSWILVKTRAGLSLDRTANLIEANLAGTQVITRNDLNRTLAQQIGGITRGRALPVVGGLIGLAGAVITGFLYALLINERKREFGLLRSIGATRRFILGLILTEVASLSIAGGVFGVGVGAGVAARTLLPAGGVGSSYPSPGGTYLGLAALLTILGVAAVGILAALRPALAVTAIDPYDAIRQGE